MAGRPSAGGRLACAHRLVEREHGAQLVYGGVAELGGCGQQVVRQWRGAALAALDVTAKQRHDRYFGLVKLGALGRVGVVVLSSDLEGTLLDSFGIDGLVDALGPAGEGVVDAPFAARLKTNANGYEDLAKWLGSKGWNSDRRASGKMEPHLAPVLIDRWFGDNQNPSPVMEPLCDWLDAILGDASATPV